eukprot:s2195_g11.t1
MATPAEEEEERGVPPRPGDPGYIEALRETHRHVPHPTVTQDYDLEEIDFWTHQHLPAGSVIEVRTAGPSDATPEAMLALMVMAKQSDADGIWVRVSVLGAEIDDLKKAMQTYFKGGRRMAHLCGLNRDGTCPVQEDDGLHVRKFRWHPPGACRVSYLNNYANKKVKDGVKMAAEELEEEPPKKKKEGEAKPGREPSDTEKRLSALRGNPPRVSFADGPERRRSVLGRGGGQPGRRAGILRRPGVSDSAPARTDALVPQVKHETVDLTEVRSESDRERSDKRKRPKESALVLAAAAHQQERLKKEEKRSRDRSRSRRRRKRHKRRRQSSSSSRSSGSRSSSESSSLLPPLRRRSQKKPGSVFQILEQQAFDFLARDGILDGQADLATGSQRPKLYTYFQLGLKPGLDSRSRDSKELALI